MNRRRLEAEAIRDSLLAVAGRLDATPWRAAVRGPGRAAADAVSSVRPHRGRTRPTSAGCSIAPTPARSSTGAASRSSAPQALFFLNDPFVSEMARRLAARVARDEAPGTPRPGFERLYALALGRPPTAGRARPRPISLLARDGQADAWERYCHLIVCQNEFLYLD